MTIALTQAAAEYVGVTVKQALTGIGAVAGNTVQWLGERPLAIAALVVLLFAFMRLMRPSSR